MVQMKSIVYLLLLAFTGISARAQMTEEVRDLIEKYLENSETTADFTQVLEDLTAYLNKPVYINRANAEELMNFPLLSASEAAAIIQHRSLYGAFLNLAELQVLGFTTDKIKTIQPFVSLETDINSKLHDLKKELKTGSSMAVYNCKFRQPQILPDSSLGDGLQMNLRLRYSIPGKYSIGLTAEKDPGEAYWNKGPDFYSFHAFFQNIGRLKAVAMGDYLISFGQGLVMGSGIGIGKSAMVMNVKRNAPVLKPYRGVNEFQFLRGGAVSVGFRKFTLTSAVAINSMDTRLVSDSNLTNTLFSSNSLDGYHRTQSELNQKGNTQRSMVGTWLTRQGKKGHWGAGSNYFSYNRALAPYSEWYRHFYPTGKDLMFVHLFQAHTLGRNHIFSEWAYCPTNRTKAIAMGVLTSLGKNADVSLHYRNYDHGFLSPFSTAFGNTNQNEKGLYAAIKINITQKVSLSHFTDFWSMPWLTYRVWAPSKGNDMLWQLDISPKKRGQIYLRFRNQNKPTSITGAEPVKLPGNNHIQSIRIHVNSLIENNLQWQMRGELAQSNSASGQYLSSLVFLQLSQNRREMRMTTRYTLFNAPFYYNRLYAFENQLQYDYGTLAFYGKGASFFLLVTQKLGRNFHIGLRASTMKYFVPGEKNSNVKNGVYVQMNYLHP